MLYKNTKNTKILTLELDSYILTVKQTKHERAIDHLPVYYMYRNPSQDLLMEVEFDYESGCFLSFTLVNCNNCLQKTILPLPDKNLKYSIGLPCIDRMAWESLNESNIFFEKLVESFKLFLGKDYLTFMLSNSRPIKYIVNNILRFGLDKNNCIISIDLLNLTKEEISIIENM